jgi:hypothetical protein
VEVGFDETRNPVMELVPTGESILVRTAPARPERDDTSGNRSDSMRRTFVTPAKPSMLDGVEAIEVRGLMYEVESVTGDASPAVITARRSKHGLRAE